MNIKCPCGEIVVEGKIENVRKKGGGSRKIFECNSYKARGYVEFRYAPYLNYRVMDYIPMNGEIHKNNSRDPNDWSGLCSKCQVNKYRRVRKNETPRQRRPP